MRRKIVSVCRNSQQKGFVCHCMSLQQFKVILTQYHLFPRPRCRRPHIHWTTVLLRLSNLLNDLVWQQFQQCCYLVVKVKRDLHGNWWFVLVPTGSFYFILADDFYFDVFHLNQHIFYVILLADVILYPAQSVVLQYNAQWFCHWYCIRNQIIDVWFQRYAEAKETLNC